MSEAVVSMSLETPQCLNRRLGNRLVWKAAYADLRKSQTYREMGMKMHWFQLSRKPGCPSLERLARFFFIWIPVDVNQDQADCQCYASLGSLPDGNRHLIASKNFDIVINQMLIDLKMPPYCSFVPTNKD